MKKVLIGVLLALLLFGCADPGIREGRVIDKHVRGAYDSTSRYCVLTTNVGGGYSTGYNGVSTYHPGVPVCVLWDETTTHHPDAYFLDLQDCTEFPEIPVTTHVRYKKCKHGSVEVDLTTYSNAVLGYPYPLLTGGR